jgi:hypothetical protein
MTLMKSRRCIAFPKPKDRVNVALQHSRSNQEIATGGIGIIDHFAQQQSKPRMSLVGQGRRSGTAQMCFRSISVSRPSGGGAGGLLSADIVAKVQNCPVLIFPR